MKPYKKYAMLLHRSASLHLLVKRPRGKILSTLATVARRKMSQSKAGQVLATVLRQVTSLNALLATPKNARTATMLGPFQEQQVPSRSHLSHSLITDSTQPL